MRGHVYYNGEEVEAEVHTEPVDPPPPMSDARFSAICQVICPLLICTAAVAATYLVGTPAVIAAGIISFFYILFTKID